MKAIGLLIFDGVMTLYEGLVISLLWNWHATRLGAPPIGIPLAIGIATIIGVCSMQHIPRHHENDAMEAVAFKLVTPTIAFLIGWLAHIAA